MKTRRPLRYVTTPAGGPAASGRPESSAGAARSALARGLLVPAIVLAAIGTGAAALPGHGTSGAAPAVTAHKHHAAHAAKASGSCAAGRTSGTRTAISMKPQIPWMYAVFAGTPSAVASKIPWMYGTPDTQSACRVIAAASHERA